MFPILKLWFRLTQGANLNKITSAPSGYSVHHKMVWITVYISAGLSIALVLLERSDQSLTCLVAASRVTVSRTQVPRLSVGMG